MSGGYRPRRSTGGPGKPPPKEGSGSQPRPLPSLRIGSHAAMSLDVDHVRVLAEDAEAVRGIVAARAALVAKQITRFIPPQRASQALCEEAFNLVCDALVELRNAGADRDKAIRHLELAAAMAITTINTLRKD